MGGQATVHTSYRWRGDEVRGQQDTATTDAHDGIG